MSEINQGTEKLCNKRERWWTVRTWVVGGNGLEYLPLETEGCEETEVVSFGDAALFSNPGQSITLISAYLLI